ncbi:MAG: nucleoside-diphosphate kinase [Methylocystaceae bacterium]
MAEQTFLMIKPDGVQRGLVGTIIARLEQKGYRMVAIKMLQITPELARQHYAEHVEKNFFPEMSQFITSSPVVAMVWEGEQVVTAMRTLVGSTNPNDAAPGTIRGDLGRSISQNLIHGSDSVASAEREIGLFFTATEIINYQRDLERWL